MPPAVPYCAYARVVLQPHPLEIQEVLCAIPGLRLHKGAYLVPHHALPLLAEQLKVLGLGFVSASWVKPQPQDASWEQVQNVLLAGKEARPEFLDGFLMSYQKEALCFGFAREGVHFWHPTGCLTGDTEIPINRAGKGYTLKLRDLVCRFNGGDAGNGRRWDPSIPTKAQCLKDGYVLLNTVHRAFPCGVKPVFRVQAGGKTIKATAEHPFFTADGEWKKLSELAAGDRILVRGKRQRRPEGDRKRKNHYVLVGVRHHPHASKVTTTLTAAKCVRGRYKPGHQVDIYRMPAHRLVVEAEMNQLSLEAFIQRCRTGGSALDGLHFLDPELHVHHVNGNHLDNRRENLVVMTEEEHLRAHANSGGWKAVALCVEAVTIDSIEPAGEEETFDLTMESPYNNYIANGFVVHNSGKTCSAILWSLLGPGPVVVVTRAAARFQYAREWERFTTLRPYVIRPASTMKKNAETLTTYLADKSSRRVVIAAWESLALYSDALTALRPGAIIWDEAHLGKSNKRYEALPLPELPEDPSEAIKVAADQEADARARGGFIKAEDNCRTLILPLENTAMAAAELSKVARRRVATTATPVKDRVRDLWAQLDLVEPWAWGSATVWMNRYADRKPGMYGGYDTRGSSNLPELQQRLRSVTHHIEYATTHRQLPPKRRQSVYIAPEDQLPPTAGFAKELKEAQKRGGTAVLEVKLQESASRKRKAVLGLVEDHVYAGGKVVLFTGRRRDVDALGELVRKCDAVKAKQAAVWAAHGDTSSEDRGNIVLDYMAHPGPCVLVGTGDSFGESLNMQDTDAALFVQLPYTPGQIRQWEGRFCRIGQKRPVNVYYVIAEGSVDEHVADILIRKLPAVEQVAKDAELAAAQDVLAGFDTQTDEASFAARILDKIARATAATTEESDDWTDDD